MPEVQALFSLARLTAQRKWVDQAPQRGGRALHRIKQPAVSWPKSPISRGTFFAATQLIILLAAGLGSVWVGQDSMGDLRNYHYYNAYAFFHGWRGQDVAAAQIQTYLNPILDLPYYLLTVLLPKSPRLIAFCMGLPFGVFALFVFRVALLLFRGRPLGIWSLVIAFILGVSGVAALSQLGGTTNEIPIAALVMAGLERLLVAIKKKESGFSAPVLLAGFLVGLAVGGKLSAVPYAAALAAAAVAGFAKQRVLRTLVALGMAGVIGVMTTGGYWMLMLANAYGNPVFPYQNEIFGSDWAIHSAYDVYYGYRPSSTIQWIFYPLWWLKRNTLVTEYPMADARFAVLLIAGALALMSHGARRFVWSDSLPSARWCAIIAFWIVGYLFWLVAFSVYRFAVSLEAVGAILTVGAVRALSPTRPLATTIGVGMIALGVVATTIYPDWGHIPFQRHAVPVDHIRVSDSALVILAGNYPMSYTVPFMPYLFAQ